MLCCAQDAFLAFTLRMDIARTELGHAKYSEKIHDLYQEVVKSCRIRSTQMLPKGPSLRNCGFEHTWYYAPIEALIRISEESSQPYCTTR